MARQAVVQVRSLLVRLNERAPREVVSAVFTSSQTQVQQLCFPLRPIAQGVLLKVQLGKFQIFLNVNVGQLLLRRAKRASQTN